MKCFHVSIRVFACFFVFALFINELTHKQEQKNVTVRIAGSKILETCRMKFLVGNNLSDYALPFPICEFILVISNPIQA